MATLCYVNSLLGWGGGEGSFILEINTFSLYLHGILTELMVWYCNSYTHECSLRSEPRPALEATVPVHLGAVFTTRKVEIRRNSNLSVFIKTPNEKIAA